MATAREYPKIGHWTQDQYLHPMHAPGLARIMALNASKFILPGMPVAFLHMLPLPTRSFRSPRVRSATEA